VGGNVQQYVETQTKCGTDNSYTHVHVIAQLIMFPVGIYYKTCWHYNNENKSLFGTKLIKTWKPYMYVQLIAIQSFSAQLP